MMYLYIINGHTPTFTYVILVYNTLKICIHAGKQCWLSVVWLQQTVIVYAVYME